MKKIVYFKKSNRQFKNKCVRYITVTIFTVPESTVNIYGSLNMFTMRVAPRLFPTKQTSLYQFEFCCFSVRRFFHPVNPHLQKDGVPPTFTTHGV